jgi:hypothetical protein
LWKIHLGGANTAIDIYEPAEPAADVVFKNLSIQGANTNIDAGIKLSGSATAATNGNIAAVDTAVQLQPCPDPCVYGGFSAATLATPVNVAVGQFIQVTVRISFS